MSTFCKQTTRARVSKPGCNGRVKSLYFAIQAESELSSAVKIGVGAFLVDDEKVGVNEDRRANHWQMCVLLPGNTLPHRSLSRILELRVACFYSRFLAAEVNGR